MQDYEQDDHHANAMKKYVDAVMTVDRKVTSKILHVNCVVCSKTVCVFAVCINLHVKMYVIDH